jgi:hypothetical protein
MDAHRSYQNVTRSDLRRLARLADEQLTDYFARHPEFALLYRRRLLCTGLAADAALHYLNGATGLEEFSCWWFFAQHPEAPFPFHMVDHADFGESKFGRAPDAPSGYVGRRVSLQGRSIEAAVDEDPLRALQRYLRSGATPSARELAEKAVILLTPEHWLGMQAWPALLL